MLDEMLVALASSGGTAVVTTAGTDAWGGLRQAVAGWFGRSDAQRERGELERLDRTAAALQTREPAEAEGERIRLQSEWRTRFEMALENLADEERRAAAEQLRSLLGEHTPAPAVSARPGGLAVGRDASIRADNGAIAAGVINGGVGLRTPQMPDPSQG